MRPELIYCASGNAIFAEISIKAGFTYGAQLPNKVYFQPEFVDQDWKSPNFKQYVNAVRQYKPRMATVLDWEQRNQLSEVLNWAEEISPLVETIIIIPKVAGGIIDLPKIIGKTPVRLGYSVPTKFGGTPVPVWEFANWPVHLLGGSPHKQKHLAYYLDVVSVDGNIHQKMATQFCAFYDPNKTTRRGHWPMLKDYDGQRWGDGTSKANAPYEAFRRSCETIKKMWAD